MEKETSNLPQTEALNITVVNGCASDEPEGCTKEWNEKVCDGCEFKNYRMGSHPGGSSYYSTEYYYCELGHWEDDF